jgi:spore coat protein A
MSGGEAEYTMAIRQLRQRLHRDLPETVVWGYDDGEGAGYPGPTIEARSGVPLRVTWENDLRDETGALRTDHYLPVDACPHGAELGGARAVVHLHGGHVPAASDGYPESTILPGERVTYEYPNWQDAAQICYHDHAMGITRLNVYMGLAGLYTIRDDVEDALDLPRGEFEVPLVVQDRTFRPDGSLAYPAAWQEDFHGEINLVNGRVWPYFEVARGRYRFRMLNGSNGRTYTFYLSNGAPFTLIGTDGGLLPAPVTLTEITLGPAERADVIVDFSELAPGTEVLLLNRAPAHYPGEADHGVVPNVMKLIVTDRVGHTAPVPSTLRPMERLDVADAVATRDFVLRRGDDPCTGRAWFINDHGWHHITERPVLGTSEVWRFVNRSGISHPMHMHLVFFQVLDRQPFEVVGEEVRLIGEPIVPEPWERGWKDTVMVHPNEMVRVIARFEDFVGRYPYHCHILEHEDHEMMRQMETTTVCGDGARGLPIEECDDGNTSDGDGCSATCAIEPGFDGGVRDGGVLDAGVRVDAGARDAGSLDGSLADGGTTPTASGCGCRAASGQRPLGALGLSALVLALLAWRSARARDKRPVGRAKGTSPKR